jgi:hypothetical protein
VEKFQRLVKRCRSDIFEMGSHGSLVLLTVPRHRLKGEVLMSVKMKFRLSQKIPPAPLIKGGEKAGRIPPFDKGGKGGFFPSEVIFTLKGRLPLWGGHASALPFATCTRVFVHLSRFSRLPGGVFNSLDYLHVTCAAAKITR